MHSLNELRILSLLFGFACLAGCSKEKLSELAGQAKKAVSEQADKVSDSVQQKVGAATDSAKEALAMAGSCELMLSEPVKTSGCYVRFTAAGSGRPGVMQVTSYRDPKQESFPSVLMSAQVQAGSLSELVGQTVKGKIFVQSAEQSPIWFSPPGTQIDLKIVSADDKQFQAEVAGGSLRNSQSGTDQTISGKFTGVFP